MMRFSTIGVIITEIIVLSQAEKFKTNLSQSIKKFHDKDLEVSETSYRSKVNILNPDFLNYDRITRREFDLPVTFKAPHYEAQDYWQDKHDYYSRRTFFEDFSYGTQDKTTTFPGFFKFMTSIFGRNDEGPPKNFQRNRHRVTPAYVFDTPISFRPNYIPPPKPIRASVIKLETITRSPFYSSFEQETTAKYYPHLGTILNHVLIENSKTQNNVRSHPQEPDTKIKISPFRSLPVLPRPIYVSPTTLKPIYPELLNNQTFYKYSNETDYKYPDSVQDQLPYLNLDEVKIPYVSEKTIPQIFDKFSTNSPPERQSNRTENFHPFLDSRTTTNILGLIDINPSGTNPEKRERLTGNIKLEFDTTAKSFPGAVEKIKRPILKYTKKVTAQLDKSSVERVANLTAQGFSKTENETTNSHKIFNYLKAKNLINYETGKLENTSQSASSANQAIIDGSLMRLVNLNDELSLDAKILKDTNWDGLTAPSASTTTSKKPKMFNINTLMVTNHTEPQPKKNKTAFWEIIQEVSTTFKTLIEAATETTITTELTTKVRTTPEFTVWPSTPGITETSEFITTEEAITRKGAQRRSENHFYKDSLKLTIDDLETSVTTNLPERMTSKKRYNRRPKIANFTPFPTMEEVQRKLINRNNFPRRQKPNITLTFGNKNVLKNRPNFGKIEVIKFPDEDKRRKIAKRRQVIKRIKISTSERPAQND